MAYDKNKSFTLKKKKYMFFSDGTGYAFDPAKLVNYMDDRISLLALHSGLVEQRNSKTVFILDDLGSIVS